MQNNFKNYLEQIKEEERKARSEIEKAKEEK